MKYLERLVEVGSLLLSAKRLIKCSPAESNQDSAGIHLKPLQYENRILIRKKYIFLEGPFMATKILIIVTLIPIYGVLIWSYLNPESSMLFGQRWMYKEEPEFSKGAIAYTKFISLLGIFIVTFTFVVTLFEHFLIIPLFIVGLFSFVIFAVLKFRNKLLK